MEEYLIKKRIEIASMKKSAYTASSVQKRAEIEKKSEHVAELLELAEAVEIVIKDIVSTMKRTRTKTVQPKKPE